MMRRFPPSRIQSRRENADSKGMMQAAREELSRWLVSEGVAPTEAVKQALSEAGRSMAELMDGQFRTDIRIWEQKVYWDSPSLVEEDAALVALRSWARQFYPGAEA